MIKYGVWLGINNLGLNPQWCGGSDRSAGNWYQSVEKYTNEYSTIATRFATYDINLAYQYRQYMSECVNKISTYEVREISGEVENY